MFITEMDAHGNCARAEDPVDPTTHTRRRSSTGGSDVSCSSTGEESFATARNSLQRQSSSSGGGSGLGITGHHQISNNQRRASVPRMMGSRSTITAAAAAQDAGNWPGGIMRQMDFRVDSRELDQLDAELRRRTQYLPREGRWTVSGDHEAIRELTNFLRNVTPPPSNLMSVPSPTTTTLSSMSSIRRRKAGTKTGTLMKMVRLFRRSSKKKQQKKLLRRPSSRMKRGSASPPGLKRSPAKRGRRPPRIKLPDTAVAGRTIDGHRHIAISIPIEHAHLGPESSRYGSPSPVIGRARSRSMSSADTPSPKVYDDIYYNTRPLAAFVTEPHIGTQLGPLVEERESLSSRSWEKVSSNGSGQGEAAIARKVRLASRNTFGTVHEEQSRPNTSSGMLFQGASPPRTSDESGEPRTPTRTSDEMRARARRQTLAALAGGGGSGGGPPTRPATGGVGSQRPLSAHSFRSFAASSPSRVYYPARKSSLHTSGAAVEMARRPRTMSNTTGGTNYSRDSSRDQTLQESIFSERSYLESLDTVDTGNLKEEFRHSPILLSEAALARRFEGSDVIEFEPRSSVDSQRRRSSDNRQSIGSHFSTGSRDKRSSGSSRASAVAKGKQRESYEGPVVVRPGNRHSGGSADMGKQTVISDRPVSRKAEKRYSGGSTTSANAILGKSEPAPAVVTRESAAAVAPAAQQQEAEVVLHQSRPTTPATGRRSKFVEDLAEASQPDDQGENAQIQGVQDQQEVETDVEPKGKEKDIQDREIDPPSIELQQATPTEVKAGQKFTDSPSRRQRTTSRRSKDEVGLQSSAGDALAVPLERSRSREKRKDKAKQQEQTSPVQLVEEIKRPGTPDGAKTEAKNTSPIPSPKERRDRRKSILLSRKERVAELRAALEKPGSQPSDLVLERKLSNASSSSSGSTLRTARLNRKRDSFPYAPAVLSPMTQRIPPKDLSFTGVLTVADVQPSTPTDVELVRKASLALSVSSPTTVATFVKTSPIPPYRSIGSVTPPDSPADSLPLHSPESQFSIVEPQGTTLRHPPPSPTTKGRITRRRSGRTSPSSSSGRRSPVIAQESSPIRPKTAGKGTIPSRKPFFEGPSPQTSTERDDSNAGPSTAQGKSILKMSRSEIFDRYEALREKQTRDMERRIRRLERHGDYWLSSMMPILNDVSHALRSAVDGLEHVDRRNGREDVDRARTPATRYNDGRQSRTANRSVEVDPETRGRRRRERDTMPPLISEDSFDPDESIVHHSSPLSPRRRSEIPQGRPRLYLHDDATLGPGQDYYPHAERSSTNSRGARSFSMNNISRHRSPATPLTVEQQAYSGSTTMVDNFSTARGNISARPSSKRASTSPNFHEDLVMEAERLARLERISEQIDAEIRRFPLVVSPKTTSSSPLAARRSYGSSRHNNSNNFAAAYEPTRRRQSQHLSSEDSEESLQTYQGTDVDMSLMEEHWSRQRGGSNGMSGAGANRRSSHHHRTRTDSFDTIEPLMRELQFSGSRISMESPSVEDMGDNEVRKMREGPGPRAVVGFGAFSM